MLCFSSRGAVPVTVSGSPFAKVHLRTSSILRREYIWKIKRKAKDMMLETVLKILGIAASVANTIVRAIDIVQRTKDKHQKSNRSSAK